MKIIGCDYHPSFQQIAMVDLDTGEYVELRLLHAGGEAQWFYESLSGPVRSKTGETPSAPLTPLRGVNVNSRGQECPRYTSGIVGVAGARSAQIPSTGSGQAPLSQDDRWWHRSLILACHDHASGIPVVC
jgi:hypothetical protein